MTGKNATVLTDTQEVELRLAKAMAHPLRIEALELLKREPLAPVEVADRLDVPLSNMSYHFRTLLELECIEEVGNERVRGSIKTTYRSCVDLLFMQARWGGVDEKALDEMRGSILRNTADRLVEAIEARTFELREEFRLTVQTVNLTEEEWKELTATLEVVRERLAEIAATSPEDDPEPRFPATFSVQAYESPHLYER
jgi:DNA-binding transcriptional ArsR family regulator